MRDHFLRMLKPGGTVWLGWYPPYGGHQQKGTMPPAEWDICLKDAGVYFSTMREGSLWGYLRRNSNPSLYPSLSSPRPTFESLPRKNHGVSADARLSQQQRMPLCVALLFARGERTEAAAAHSPRTQEHALMVTTSLGAAAHVASRQTAQATHTWQHRPSFARFHPANGAIARA